MENKKNFIINIIYITLILGIIYLIYKYLFSALMPFIIGFVLAYLSLLISNKIFKDKNNKFTKIVSLLVIYLLIIVVVVLLTLFITDEFVGFISSLPSLYKTYLDPLITSLEKNLNDLNGAMPSDVRNILSQSIDGIFETIKNLVTSFSTSVVSIVTSIITYTPTLLISILVTIISSFFFIDDYDNIVNKIISIIPIKAKNELSKIKDFIVNNVFEVIKCYGLIMFITFVELSIGFLILKIQNPIMLAALICVVDILPVLGVGTVLIPWGIVALFLKNYFIGIGIIVLYLIITIIRNIIEPKFVGSTLGLDPLLTLVAMIIGMNLAGIIGLLSAPLITSYLLENFKISKNKE